MHTATAAMRLLRRSSSGNIELVSFEDSDNRPPYAILSHTWTEGQEVTYDELSTDTGTTKAGYDKIRFCVDRAARDGLEYAWVDTCCIDKSNQLELQIAINSMFRWYQQARKCYVYLSDVSVCGRTSNVVTGRVSWKQAFRRSRWFTRGWTLQELLAPRTVEFFSKEQKKLGDKRDLERDIYEATDIPVQALRGRPLSEFSVDQRMSWTDGRTTSREEDSVYCLTGIFGVFVMPNYGEGRKYASFRLEDEIQKREGWQEATLEERWAELLDRRQVRDRCRNCGMSGHWESQCQPRECGRCKHPLFRNCSHRVPS